MKVAVIKIGSRIAYGSKDTSGGNGEAKSIIKMLHQGGAEIDIYTKILKKDRNPEHLTFWNIEDEFENINSRDYEGLVVLNGNVNFFGGAESPDQILNYWLINNFKGQVFYIYCDPALQLKQLWGAIERKEWASNWKKEDILIERKDIVYVSQPYALGDVQEIIDKSGIEVSKIIHYPFEKFPCLNEKIPPKENPSYDLLYGGTMRGNKRIDKMVKFYFGFDDSIKVEMFGKIKEEDLKKRAAKNKNTGRPPSYGSPVKYDDFMVKMNDTLAHTVIGDKWYEGRDMAQRCYESVWASVITFIDIEMDPEKRVFGSSDLCSKFNYVASVKDVEKRIIALKENPKVRQQILEEQIRAISFDANEYCGGFIKILEENSSNPISEPLVKEDDKVPLF